MADELTPYIVKFKKGDVVFSEGDSGSEMYFIHSGLVKIQKKMETGVETLAVMEKGDFFGEMSVIESIPRSASAVVEEDADLLKIDAGNFEKILSGNIEIAVRMIRKYAERLRESNQKLEGMLRDRHSMNQELEQLIKTTKETVAANSSSESTVLAKLQGEGHSLTYEIRKNLITIGRKDPVTGITPDLDLTDVDKNRSTSRRHAKIQFEGKQATLTEEIGVQNGTFVNGEKVAAGTSAKLQDGARVGFGTLVFTFKVSTKL